MISDKQHTHILSVGDIPELLSLRAEVLKWAGYDVITTSNLLEAASQIQEGRCGVLLLCYSVSEESRKELIRDFRRQCPNGRIVVITNERVPQLPKDVDELVFGIEGPEALLDAIEPKAA